MHEKYHNHENYYHKQKQKKPKTIHNVRNLNIDPQPKTKINTQRKTWNMQNKYLNEIYS
jgi:hypothetical protein